MEPAKDSTAPTPESAEQKSPAEAQLAAQVQELQAQLKDKESKYLYLYAEFENYKKRAVKERSDLLKYGWEGVAQDLLQVLDNLERALAHMPPTTDKSLADGLHMVVNQFHSTLAKQGVQPIECVQKPFDPNLHEAVGAEPSDLPQGTITKEHVRGYQLHGRLLRPARVTVSEGARQG